MPDLVAVRRQLHAHPELGWAERQTTAYVGSLLRDAGLAPTVLRDGVGLVCDIGNTGNIDASADDEPVLLLRADLDALPLDDEKDVPYASTVPGVCHACGHDVHTAVLVGAARALTVNPPTRGRVRLLFQPAEERMPGGALAALELGVLDGVSLALALHCDPSLDVGHLGVRSGAITAAADNVEVTLRGPGGHTSRPQNTVDLVYALAAVVVGIPSVLSRTVDARASLSLVWGALSAGSASNAIPRLGIARGTVRTLDHDAWEQAPGRVTAAAEQLAAAYGATVAVEYVRGVPPVVNDPAGTALLAAAGAAVLGAAGVVDTAQSLGGEDFGWVLDKVPGAMARLGTRRPGGPTYDLHQGGFDVDEDCLRVGAGVLAAAARAYLA